MNKANLLEAVPPDKLQARLRDAFSEAGITSVELLKDDKRVQYAALMAYDKLPLFPVRAGIKATIGKDGFLKVIFNVRDRMLESKSMDLS